MLNESMFHPDHQPGTTDRRSSSRRTTREEIIITWWHAPGMPIRYRLIDRGDGGARIHASVPVPVYTSGSVERILPGGEVIDQPVRVAWISESEDGWDIGLRLLGRAS